MEGECKVKLISVLVNGVDYINTSLQAITVTQVEEDFNFEFNWVYEENAHLEFDEQDEVFVKFKLVQK
jgi:hypothetical protein